MKMIKLTAFEQSQVRRKSKMVDWNSPQMKNWRRGQWMGMMTRSRLAFKDIFSDSPQKAEAISEELRVLAKEGARISEEIEQLLRSLKKDK